MSEKQVRFWVCRECQAHHWEEVKVCIPCGSEDIYVHDAKILEDVYIEEDSTDAPIRTDLP